MVLDKLNFLATQDKLLTALSVMRFSVFAAEGIALPLMDRWLNPAHRPKPKSYPKHLQEALPKILHLLQQDTDAIKQGIYPVSCLLPEPPLQHFRRLPLVYWDALRSIQKRNKKDPHSFSEEAKKYFDLVPEYFQRTFHFQTDGYLGETSAELYEHQVEILFSGTADPMRRLVLRELFAANPELKSRPLKILELGSGTGRLTKFLALAFPQASISCLEPSPQYLKLAQTRLKDFPRVSFNQGIGEDIPFKDENFDLVVSSFLFHELPLEIRHQVVKESSRVLKPGGLMVIVDSLQIDDDPSLNWALESFPKDFHEPFYKNYVQNPLQQIATQEGLKVLREATGFLSKSLVAQK
jgi:ubiquinone/menaquinone biosynthesis C-methylase UbiE